MNTINSSYGNRERMIRTCLSLEVDRIPFWFMFGPWGETLERWHSEGLEGYDWKAPFGFDAGFETLPVNLGYLPAFTREILSDDGKYQTVRDTNGVTFIQIKNHSTIPKFIDYPVKTRADWERLRDERLDPDMPGRFPENWLKAIAGMKERGAAVQIGSFPYGLFGTLREMMGVETLLTSFYDDPELIHEMMDFLTDFWIGLYAKAMADVQIDHIHIWEDMSGKQGPLISPAMFREFMTPNYKKIARFARDNNIPVLSVDTDGNMDVLMPLLAESGVNLALPFEVQAGCDVVTYKQKYPSICLCGGIDKREIALGPDAIDRELDRIGPLLRGSGYLPMLDHLPHPEISFADFTYFTEELRKRIFA